MTLESTTSNSRRTTYWAAEEDLGPLLQKKLDACREALNNSEHLRQVATAYTHYFGRDIEGVGASASTVVRAGDQGEMAEIRVPQSRALANAVLTIVTGAKPAWNALPINNDHAARAACVCCSGALEYYWKDKDAYAKAAQSALEAILFGEGVLFTPWDTELGAPKLAFEGRAIHEGDVAFHNVSTWDVLRDPTYRSWDELPWVGLVIWQNRYDVAARYPKLAEKVLAASSQSSGIRWTPFGNVAMEPDTIPVTFFFHKRTPALQKGREVVTLDGGVILSDMPLSEANAKRWPIHRMSAGELFASPFPHTSFWDALGVAQVADSLHTSLTSNITATASGLISVEVGNELAPDDLAGGPKILYRKAGSQPPVVVELRKASPEEFKYLDVLRKEAQQILSLNSTSLGEPEGKGLSGAAYALLSSMSIQNNSHLQANWVGFIISIGNSVLAHFQHDMKAPRQIAISGKGRASLVKSLSLDAKDLAGVDRVVVEIGNPMQQTAAGRMELAQLFLSIPNLLKSPDQIQGVVDTGRMDPLTQNLSNQLLLIAQENEALSEGKSIPVVLTDDHRLHIQEHPGVGASTEARTNPQIMQALQQHIAEHIKVLRETDPGILMALGQQPIPPPQPPMGPPGMPPGGPPPPGGAAAGPGGPPPPPGAAEPPAPGDNNAMPGNMPSMPVNPLTKQKAPPPAGMPIQ